MRRVFIIFLATCFTSWAPNAITGFQSKMKPVLVEKLPVWPKVQSDRDQIIMQQLVDSNLGLKKYNVINKSRFAEVMNPTYEEIAKNASSPGFSVLALPPVLQELTIRIHQSNPGSLDSLTYHILILPPQTRKKSDFEVVPSKFLIGKTPIQAIEALLDSLTFPRNGKIVF